MHWFLFYSLHKKTKKEFQKFCCCLWRSPSQRGACTATSGVQASGTLVLEGLYERGRIRFLRSVRATARCYVYINCATTALCYALHQLYDYYHYVMTNDTIIKNTVASSSESGYVYIFIVSWFALLSTVFLNTEIGLLASVLLEYESGIAIVFFVNCSVNILYLPYFWIKVFRKILIYSTATNCTVPQSQKKLY